MQSSRTESCRLPRPSDEMPPLVMHVGTQGEIIPNAAGRRRRFEPDTVSTAKTAALTMRQSLWLFKRADILRAGTDEEGTRHLS